MTELSKKILEKIEQENIRPYPKQYFWFKRSVIWGLFVLSVLLGALSSGLIIYHLGHTEWDLYPHFNQSFWQFLLMAIPYLWLAFLVAFSFLMYHYFRQTEHGYRYRASLVISASVLFSLIGGFVLNEIQAPQRLDTYLEKTVPFYKGLHKRRMEMWLSPQKGLLAGSVEKIKSDGQIRLKDFKGKIWKVDISQAVWRGRTSEREGAQIKIIGKMLNDSSFQALEIRPWIGRGKGRGRYRGQRSGRRF
jgi:hypothetical protein